MLHKVSNIAFQLIEFLIRNLTGLLGRNLRYYYYRRRLGSCGKNVVIDSGVSFSDPVSVHLGSNVWIDSHVIILSGAPDKGRNIEFKPNPDFRYEVGELHIGNDVHIAPFSVLQAHGGISIGEKSGIAAGSKIYSMSHHYRNTTNSLDKKRYHFSSMTPKQEQFLICAAVVIGRSTAIGLNSIVLPGTTVPDEVWLGVQTYTKGYDMKEGCVYVGTAASLAKK